MPSGGLPPGFDLLFNNDGEAARHVLDVDLPPGRLVQPREEESAWDGPAYWLSDEPAGPDLWVRLRQAHARSGLWPVFANPSDFHDDRPWVAGEVSPQPVADIGRVTAGDLLAGFWRAWIRGEHHLWLESDDPLELASGFTVSRDDGFAELEPFGQGWPGLAPPGDGPDPDEFADQYVLGNDDGTSRIMLVPAVRGADVLTAVGWDGAVNYIQPKSLLSSVLRSWEERFGARLIEAGFDTLHLAVSAPPVSPGHAERVAAEHFAFCPDNIVQGLSGTIRAYAAKYVLGKADWWFWWD
jgi:Domain of unknown function (DUF4253)